jgi:hypothetical protein
MASLENQADMTVPPFYFFVTVWGESYVDSMLRYCIPSLLSPNNIPSLQGGRRNKFLIACPEKEWAVIQAAPIYPLLSQYTEVVWHPIPAPQPKESKYALMGLGHKFTTQMIYHDRAIGFLLTPDFMCSDGAVASAMRHVQNGARVVLTAALRFSEEKLFAELTAESPTGWSVEGAPLPSEALVLPPRVLTQAAVRGLHIESLTYEWDAPYLPQVPSACWWKVRGEKDAVLLHSLSWAPIAMDYRVVEEHADSIFDIWTIDGDYVYTNFGDHDGIYVVQDSDELIQVSWSRDADSRESLRAKFWQCFPFINRLVKGLTLRSALASHIFDPLKRRIVVLPVYWHGRDINENWVRQERRVQSILRFYIPPEEFCESGEITPLQRVRYSILHGLTYALRFILLVWDMPKAIPLILPVLYRAACFDRHAWQRIGRRISLYKSIVLNERPPVD